MQIMAEALGLALPGSALMPATSPDLLAYARQAGRRAVVEMAGCDAMRPSRIVTMDSFENAILVHAAISGSTNCLLHLPATHELGIEITGDTFGPAAPGRPVPAGRPSRRPLARRVLLLRRRRARHHGGDP